MRDVALFVPCYVDQLSPQVAWDTVDVLERAGCRVHYEADQTCCGQPFLNTGARREAKRLAARHCERFAKHETVVSPSGSCVATVRNRFAELGIDPQGPDAQCRTRTYELAEFLVDELRVETLGARFPHRVAVLQSCHGLRDLGLAPGSEQGPDAPETRDAVSLLLDKVEGLERVTPDRADDCCGFGGTFAVKYPEVSARMGKSRLAGFSGAEFVVGTDVSCLLHLEGLRARAGKGPRPIHLAQVLAGRAPA